MMRKSSFLAAQKRPAGQYETLWLQKAVLLPRQRFCIFSALVASPRSLFSHWSRSCAESPYLQTVHKATFPQGSYSGGLLADRTAATAVPLGMGNGCRARANAPALVETGNWSALLGAPDVVTTTQRRAVPVLQLTRTHRARVAIDVASQGA